MHSYHAKKHYAACERRWQQGNPSSVVEQDGHLCKFAEKGGADLIITTTPGVIAWQDVVRLPDSCPMATLTASLLKWQRRCFRRQRHTSAGGVCGTDPFRLLPVFIKHSKKWVSQVCEFPHRGID